MLRETGALVREKEAVFLLTRDKEEQHLFLLTRDKEEQHLAKIHQMRSCSFELASAREVEAQLRTRVQAVEEDGAPLKAS